MKLFLIRHGETPWTQSRRYQGKTDIPLTPKGIQQAKAIAHALRRDPPSQLYTSTLQRARDTAQVIAQELRVKVIADPRLNEIDFGKWEGASFDRLPELERSRFRKWREGKLRKAPGGESLASLSRRVGEILKEILHRHAEETIAVITHGGPIKTFLFKALKAESPSIWSFQIDPGSISLLEGNRNLLQIVWTNRTDHLNSR